ncbi:MAG: hypothetical protein J5836_01135 [Clostridia bacterium]|nr:hypothetical protein [Clostridia bacterium]
MFDSAIKNAIVINSDLNVVEFYKDVRGQKKGRGNSEPKIAHEAEVFKTIAFDDEFFEVLKNMVKLHFGGGNAKVALVLPDSLFFTDLFKSPVVKGRTESFINVMVGTLYKNYAELKVKQFLLAQSKQSVTYGIFGTRQELLKKVCQAVEGGGVSVAYTTAFSCAAAAGAAALEPKLRSASYLLLNVEENATNYVYVIGGRTVGFYSLPFGAASFSKDSLDQEFDLFARKAALSVVIKAEEKAKNKRVSEDDEALAKKLGKGVPRFVSTENFTSEEDYIYENFRITIKYALEIIKNNPELTAVEYPKAVYVNVPRKYGFIYDRLRSEGGSVSFEPFAPAEEMQENVSLAVYGGFNLKKYNKSNNF